MEQIGDQELAGRGALGGVSRDPFTAGLYVLGLSKEQIAPLGDFLHELYELLTVRHNRQVTRNGQAMLTGGIFAIGTMELNNPEWKEHCASSLREVFHEWDGDGQFTRDFTSFYRNNGERLEDSEKTLLRDFWNHYKYLSGIDHHSASMIMHALRAILKDNTLKLEDCYKDDIFIERVKTYFTHLEQIRILSKKVKKS